MWVRIDEEEMVNKVMKALSNLNLRRFLTSCSDEPKSVSNMAAELNLPLSTTYNYVHELVEAGLLAIERSIISDEGKRYEMYRSIAREVKTTIESNRMVVEILPNENVASRFYRLWSSLREMK